MISEQQPDLEDVVQLSLVIPAYNEASRLPGSLERMLSFARSQPFAVEILVVDDGSTDGTAEGVLDAAKGQDRVRLISNGSNRGKGYSVRHGMREASGRRVLFSDADLATPIAEARRLLAALDGGADVAIGVRSRSAGQSLLRQLAGTVFNKVVVALLGLRLSDTQCGMKAFSREAAAAIFPYQQIEGFGFDPEVLFIAKLRGLKVAAVPVAWQHVDGSKVHVLRDSVRMFFDVLRVRRFALTGRYRQATTPEPRSTIEEGSP